MHLKRLKQKQKNPNYSFSFEAIGTHWVIDIHEQIPYAKRKKIKEKIFSRIESFDQVYSRFREDSLITRISQKAGTYVFPEDSLLLFLLYQKLYILTSGLVTPLVGSLLAEAGYDKNYSLVPQSFNKPPTWEESIEFLFPELLVKKPVLLDFGAAGKGYLIDIIGELLEKEGFRLFCIDAGGDIKTSGYPMRVGLEHPADSTQVVGEVLLERGSICGSAGNRRKWNDLHHIFNPETLTPVKEIIAVWVTAPTALVADGLSTALFFIEPERLLSAGFQFEYFLIHEDFSYEKSENFPGIVYA